MKHRTLAIVITTIALTFTLWTFTSAGLYEEPEPFKPEPKEWYTP